MLDQYTLKSRKILLDTFFLIFIIFSKYTFVLAEIQDGANALDQIGQFDQTNIVSPVPVYTKSGSYDSPNRLGFYSPEGIAIDEVDHRLFVSDTFNHRILIYNLDSSNNLIDRVPDNVLGQPNFYTTESATTQTSLNQPTNLAYASNNKLFFVCDSGNNRVLVYDLTSITNGEAAIRVLGQPDFVSTASATTSSGINGPSGLVLNGTNNLLYVGDSDNNRVLVFNVSSITNGESAVNVLGQSNFTTSTSSYTNSSTPAVNSLAYDNVADRLFVGQVGYRVTVFDTSSISNGESAISILGQTDYSASGFGGITDSSFGTVRGLSYDNSTDKLFLTDSTANRVLVFDAATITDGESAISVIGQPNFTSSSNSDNQSNFGGIRSVVISESNSLLYVVDRTNSRVMIFNVSSITDGEAATDLLGQYDGVTASNPATIYSKSSINNSPNQYGLSSPNDVVIDEVNHKMFISDAGSNRILVHNLSSDNLQEDRIPDYVLGQPDFVTTGSAVSQTKLNNPQGLDLNVQNQLLFVADTSNRRVVVFDVSTLSNGQAAAYVIGQPNFTSNSSGTSSTTMNLPNDVTFDEVNNRLYVADTSNSRVLVFNTSTITNGEAAFAVLGQPDFLSNSTDTTQSKLNSPSGVLITESGNTLYIADTTNNRVLVFDVSTISDGENAINVLGQTDFITSTSAATTIGFANPRQIYLRESSKELFVSDSSRNRILVFDVNSTTNGEAAVHVLGQSDFTTTTSGSTSQSNLASPVGISLAESTKRLYVADGSQNRIMEFPIEYPMTYSSSTFTENTANDGTIANSLTLSLKNATFSISSGAFTQGVHFTVANVPTGLSVSITATSSTTAQITFSGTANSHENLNDISNFTIAFLDAAFSGIAASNVTNSTNSGITIDFTDAPTATPSPTATSTISPEATPTTPPGTNNSGSILLNGTPLPSVYINGSLLGSASTDSDGSYSFSSITEGEEYLITPKREGYTFSPSSAVAIGGQPFAVFSASSLDRNISKCTSSVKTSARVNLDNKVKAVYAQGITSLRRFNLLVNKLEGAKKTSAVAKSKSTESILKRNFKKYQIASLALPVEWLSCRSNSGCRKQKINTKLNKVSSATSNLNSTVLSAFNLSTKYLTGQSSYVTKQKASLSTRIRDINKRRKSFVQFTWSC